MKSKLFVLLFIISVVGCQNNQISEVERYLKSDSTLAVIQDSVIIKYSRKGFEFYRPTISHFIKTDSLLIQACDSGKFNFLKKPQFEKLPLFHRQYAFYRDLKTNEEFVYINAFCDSIEELNFVIQETGEPFDWKKHLYIVDDGGACYWGAILNLSRMKIEHFWVN